ncbi:MAG: TIGR01440 family protein [Oscillospiraceae bacterium]|jgi:uncharacterized protein (TIGR01440 family)
MYEDITAAARAAMEELLEAASCRPGDLVVVGCSTSEIAGEPIGKGRVPQVAAAVLEGLLPPLKERGLYLAAQCCEHLNRALVIEREAAEKYGYEPAWVRPVPEAGGSFAAAAFDAMSDPVVVEHIRAAAGLDIGNTLIGMHLKEVAVPLRLKVKTVGKAQVVAARTRPKLIGGARAVYD